MPETEYFVNSIDLAPKKRADKKTAANFFTATFGEVNHFAEKNFGD